MKKIILALFALTIIGVSCSKQGTVTEPITNTTIKHTRKAKPTATQHFESSIKDCMKPASNCASTVVIHPHASEFARLDVAIASGPSAVTAFFNTSSGVTLINEYFGEDYLTVLQSGSYNMISSYNSEIETTFYLLGLASTLSLSNAELVVPTIQ